MASPDRYLRGYVQPVPGPETRDLALAYVLNVDESMDDVRASRLPAACPSCLALEGVPTEIIEKSAEDHDVWLRCCRCAHEWRVVSEPQQIRVRRKVDRRQQPREE